MKYQAYFTAVNDIDYKIEIETKTGTGTKELVLGDNPIITEMADEEILYSPIRTTGATIEIVTDIMPFDIYTGQATGTKVKLINITEYNKLEWLGFVQPCAYNQGFDYEVETVQLECIDALSALQYIPYRTEDKNMETFINIIFKCLKQTEVINYLYISDNVQITSSTATESICEKLRILESNFFEKKDDLNTPDDNVAWNCLDVLSELCRFLGYTAVCEGDVVYLIDYDAIRRNKNTYWVYNVSGNSPVKTEYITKTFSKYISTVEDYSDSGNSMSLDTVYNKVTVKDEFYTYDTLFPEMGENFLDTNITADEDRDFRTYVHWNPLDPLHADNHYKLVDTIQVTNKNGKKENYHIWIAWSWDRKWRVCVYKFYSSKVFNFHRYNWNRQEITEKSNGTFSELFSCNGCWAVKYYSKDISENDFNNFRSSGPSTWWTMTNEQRHLKWTNFLLAEPSSLKLEPMLVCLNHDKGHIGPGNSNRTNNYHNSGDDEDCKYKPYVSLKPEYKDPKVFGGEGSYVIINGTFQYHDEDITVYPLCPDNNKNLKYEEDLKDNGQFFIWAKFKWGGKYWNGMEWSNTEAWFKIYYRETELGRTDRYNRTHYARDYEFIDTAWKYGYEEKGYCIPAPKDRNLTGTPEFILCANKDMSGDSRRSHWHPDYNYNDNFYTRYRSRCIFIKKFSVKPYVSNGVFDDMGNETDTLYTNYTNNGSIHEMDEITFKVCTYDYKKNTYSSVEYLENGISKYIDCTYNKALYQEQLGDDTSGSTNTKAFMKQEEHYVYKVTSQYEKPRVILELNLRNVGYKLYGTYTDKTISGRTYVAKTISTDYKYNKQTVKLIEKF